MALNVTFTCNANSIVDENENPIDCNYKAYYVRQGVWNNTRTSDQQQFNFSAGDADSLSQTGELKANDVVIICLWQDELDGGSTSDNTSGLKTRFTTFSIVHDGTSNIYVIDPQLMPKMVPTCDWSFELDPVINESYTATPLSDDEDSWIYNENTFYHRRLYYSTLIFDQVGLITDEYDFESSGTFESSNIHTYASIADFTARHKATNAYSLFNICDKSVKSHYHVPLPDIVFSPDGILSKFYHGDDIDVFFHAYGGYDEDSRVTGIDTKLNFKLKNGTIDSTDHSSTANASDVTITHNITALNKIEGEMLVHWNDGWNDLSFTIKESHEVTNTLPITELSKTQLTPRIQRFNHLTTDVDGSITDANYKTYLLMPFGAGWTLVQEDNHNGISLTDALEIEFAQNGHYKTVLEVRDNANDLVYQPNGIANDEIEFDIELTECSDESYEQAKLEEIYFIFPDVNKEL